VDGKQALDNITLLLPDNNTLKVTAVNPALWNFQQAYVSKSGTKAIHELQVKLPECTLANVCSADKPFTISFPRTNRQNLNSARFSIGKEDVSTLFYFNEQQQAFKIKEFYEPRFFDRFKGGKADFSWRVGYGKNAYADSVTVRLANKAVKGKIITATGKIPNYLAGKEISFIFSGSDTLLPHTMKASINKRGEYLLDNLPTFEYKPLLPSLYDAALELKSYEVIDGKAYLSVLHVVPDYDAVFTVDTKGYRAGEFVVFSPASANPNFFGDISEFIQTSGDTAFFKPFRKNAAIIFPDRRVKEEEISFSAKVGGKKILFIFPQPIEIEKGYEQFSPFFGDGYYAHTILEGFDSSGVLSFGAKNIPSARINSFTNSSADSVKVHLFDPLGKAVDITSYFDWDNSAQRLTLNKSKFINLYTELKNNYSTLGVTFCGASDKSRCFRIKKEIRPAAASFIVTPTVKPTDDMFAALRQLDNTAQPVVRLAKASKDGKFIFSDVPEGRYQILLADLALKNQGYTYSSVTFEDNEEKTEINIVLPVSTIDPVKPDYQRVTRGNWIALMQEPLKIYKNDFKSIDLKAFNISSIDEISIAGYFPGEYSLHSDLSVIFYTGDNYNDLYSVLILRDKETLYTLPIFYNGNEPPIISEEGLDYTMCPKDRPHCSNAFVDIKGVTSGVYNGKNPLSLSFPITFNRQDLSVIMEQMSDITNLFLVNSKYNRITLKRSSIPAFLSYLSTNTSPIRINIKNRRYYLDLAAGYKNAEISVTDRLGAQNSLFSNLELNIACERGGKRIYSRNAAVTSSGFVQLDDLPDCAYHITLIDRKRFFSGELDMNLQAGQNKKKEILQVNCVSSDDQFINNCVPIIPLISRNRLIAPEIALFFTDELKANVRSIKEEKRESLNSKLLGRAIIFYAPKSKDGKAFQSKIILNEDNISPLNIAVESIASYRIRTLSKPAGSPVPVLRLAGVNDAFTYQGGEFAITFDNMGKFSYSEISVACRNTNITEMFSYDNSTKTLTLLQGSYGDFAALFNDGWLQLSIRIGENERLYNIALVLTASSSDIFVSVVGEIGLNTRNASAILSGSRNVNGFEYRQESRLNSNSIAIFRQVPFGIYNLTVFDMDANIFGSAEVSVPLEKTDLYLDLEVNKIVE
jgi:hypothetical protein